MASRTLASPSQLFAHAPRFSSSMAAKIKPTYTVVEKIDDFGKIQAEKPEFEPRRKIKTTKHPNPEWKFGQGVKRDAKTKHRIAPRPIGFISTPSGDGKTKNLAPFSYFQIVEHDPPMVIVEFSSRSGREKDTLRNLRESRECAINSVSEDMIEAVNATSIEAPYNVSECDVSGSTEAATTTVKPLRVQESVLSIEAKAFDIKEFEAHCEGMSRAGLVRMKATRFWVREDATSEGGSSVDLSVLRPVRQLGGISYARIASIFELPRGRWRDETPKSALLMELEDDAKKSE